MPSRPYIGLAEPGGGASPMDCSSAEDGPNSCSQASAVTCGAIISGSRKATDRMRLPRMSVAPTRKASKPPSPSDRTDDQSATSNVLAVARTEAVRLISVQKASSPGAKAAISRRAIGTRASSRTATPRTR
jgi:hypothetical protein